MQNLKRRFLLWYGATPVFLLVGVPLLLQITPPAMADGIELIWYFSLPVLAIAAAYFVRVVKGDDPWETRRAAKYLSIGFTVLWLVVTILVLPRYEDYTVRAKILNGVINLSAPARTAVGVACSEYTLRVGMKNSELGLSNPAGYSGGPVISVHAQVVDEATADIVVRLHEQRDRTDLWRISPVRTVVPEGGTIVFHAKCSSGGVQWTVDGTIAEAYLPKV